MFCFVRITCDPLDYCPPKHECAYYGCMGVDTMDIWMCIIWIDGCSMDG